MKAAVYYGPRDVRVEEVPTPTLGPGDALLRVRACGICGSDLHTYRHGLFETLGVPAGGGRIMGHEFCGEVVEVSGDSPLKVGDRVCAIGMGGNAEYFQIPAELAPFAVPIPEGLSFVEAATTEPLATSLHAVNLARPADGETHVVLGAGIIGLGILQVLKARYNLRTVVVDLADCRLEVAKKLGADEVINAGREDAVRRVMELTGSEQLSFMPEPTGRADVAYDAAGLARGYTGVPVVQQAMLMVRSEGRVVVVSVFEQDAAVDFNPLVRKGLSLLGSWAWSPDEFKDALGLIASGKVDRKPLISHTFSLEAAAEAYETQLRAEEAVKVVITP